MCCCWLHLPGLHSFVFLRCFSSLAFSILLDDHSKSMCFVLSIKGSETELFLLYGRFSVGFCFFDFLIEVKLNYNVVLISHVDKSDSIIHAYIYIYSFLLRFFSVIQHTEYSSLCSAIGASCLFHMQ